MRGGQLFENRDFVLLWGGGPLAVGYLFGHLGPTKTVLIAAAWTLALAIAATAAPSIKNAPAAS
jgi:hypothetical protein